MPSVTLSLHHFNQSVTACELIIDRASLCDLINTGNPEAIVVVDERYCPLASSINNSTPKPETPPPAAWI